MAKTETHASGDITVKTEIKFDKPFPCLRKLRTGTPEYEASSFYKYEELTVLFFEPEMGIVISSTKNPKYSGSTAITPAGKRIDASANNFIYWTILEGSVTFDCTKISIKTVEDGESEHRSLTSTT